MRTLLTVLALLPTLLPAPARAAAPYPHSTTIAGLRWDTATYRSGGVGGDIWPVTWGADGRVYAAWGDGQLGCPAKVGPYLRTERCTVIRSCESRPRK